jgi:hypothetical protein
MEATIPILIAAAAKVQNSRALGLRVFRINGTARTETETARSGFIVVTGSIRSSPAG